ncbi:MAG TPA: redoxin domain-containing protein [Chitinophagales bacterium]|nr:redoxin domain-containing protein [Chitinophagales bacterium]
MKLLHLFLVIFCVSVIGSCAKKQKLDFSLQLPTVEHQKFSFSELQNNKASIILFLQPECPFCNSYGKTLRLLDSVFQSQQVRMYGVVAGKFYPDSEIVSYKEKFQLQFPFLLDPDFVLKKDLKASVTPQAYLVDAKGNVIYHGMIDNWGYEIGKARAHATEFYLTEAVNNFLAGKPIASDSTKAVGCYIQ